MRKGITSDDRVVLDHPVANPPMQGGVAVDVDEHVTPLAKIQR
jgi:hypothetical protein